MFSLFGKKDPAAELAKLELKIEEAKKATAPLELRMQMPDLLKEHAKLKEKLGLK